MALNYFDAPKGTKLPKGSGIDFNEWMKTDIEYFLEAADLLFSHPKVMKTGLEVIGVSKGAEIAYLMAAYSPKVGI